jgi:hypothetical protein
LLVWTHPDAGLQESSVHGSWSSQSGVPVPGWQLPPLQASPRVQKFPSLHGTVLFEEAQPISVHESSVQLLRSSQPLSTLTDPLIALKCAWQKYGKHPAAEKV